MKYILFIFSLLLVCVINGCDSGSGPSMLDEQMPDDENPDDENPDGELPDEGVPYDGRLVNNLDVYPLSAAGNDAAFDGQQWVVVGEDIYVSPDAIHWEAINTGFATVFSQIVWNGEVFVVLGGSRIFTSPDARTWSVVADFGHSGLEDVVWTGEEFFALVGHNELYRSTDGSEWVLLDGSPPMDELLWAGDRLVGIGNYVHVSTDHGITWSDRNASESPGFGYDLLYANGIIYAFGSTNVYTSTDGFMWEKTSTTGKVGDNPVFYAGFFYGISSKASSGSPVLDLGAIVQSATGVDWSEVNTGTHGLLSRLVPSQEGLLAVGSDILYTADGTEWEYRVPHFHDSLRRVRWSIDRALFTGFGDGLLVTKDLASFDLFGFTWAGSSYWSATWTGERYVIVDSSGRIVVSNNGSQLTSPSSPTSEELTDVVSGSKGVVAVGRNGTLLYSADGTSWENHSLSDGTRFTRVETIEDDFYAVGDEGIYHSDDGREWQQIILVPGASSQPQINDIAYDGTTFVATTGNRYGQLYTSRDGINWVRRDPRADDGFYYLAVEYTGHEFIALHDGITRGAWIDASDDGILWTRIYTFPTELDVYDLAWTGNGLVLAGDFHTPVIVGTVR